MSYLGDYSEPLDVDYNVDSLERPESAYLAWTAAVKALGGTPTAYPFHGTPPWRDFFTLRFTDTWGLPAARYPWTRIYSSGGAFRAPFETEPDNAVSTPAGDFGFYLAPVSILAWAAAGGLAKFQADGGAALDQTPPGIKPKWYDDLLKAAKYVGVGGAALAAVALLSFIPRRR
jgi:hypothetical protein